jgi:hypothetical protein
MSNAQRNRVVTFQSNQRRKVRGTDVMPGDTLYAVQDTNTNYYFIWAYTNKEQAEYISRIARIENETDLGANWRRKLDQLIPTDFVDVHLRRHDES